MKKLMLSLIMLAIFSSSNSSQQKHHHNKINTIDCVEEKPIVVEEWMLNSNSWGKNNRII